MQLHRIALVTLVTALSVSGLVGQEKGQEQEIATSYISGDTVRIPYQAHRIYHLRCVKGAPLMVELPLGETVKNVWLDRMYFIGEAVPGSGRVLLKAQNAEGVDYQKTTVHIETSGDLRISAVLECLPSNTRTIPPSVYTFYLDGQDEQVARNRLIQIRADEAAQAYKEVIDERYRATFTQWKAEALGKINDKYAVKGSADIGKVVDDGVQTWIYASGMTEINSLKAINRDKQEETVNFEYVNGVYVINRVLASGEKFELSIGKEKTTVSRN